MPRRPNIVPSTPLNVMLPEDVRAQLDLILYSKVDGRVPWGAYQRFFLGLLREFFEHETANLEPYGFPPGAKIRGDGTTMKAVLANLGRPDRRKDLRGRNNHQGDKQ